MYEISSTWLKLARMASVERIEVGVFLVTGCKKLYFTSQEKIEELIKNANYVTYLCWYFCRLAFFKRAVMA